MKKLWLGMYISMICFLSFLFTLIYASLNPWYYNGIDGIIGSLIGTGILFFTIVFFIGFIIGNVIIYKSYREIKNS